MREYNIVITGVGGQGVLTAANILGWAAMRSNYRVFIGEVHGMAQRFGSVVSYVRFGSDVYAPLVPEGKGDVILSFEPVEALRYAEHLKKGGMVVVNENPVVPFHVSIGAAKYPELEEIRRIFEEEFEATWIGFNAEELAERAGGVVATNTVLIGAISEVPGFPLSAERIKEAIKLSVPKHALEMNLRAFELGREATLKALQEVNR